MKKFVKFALAVSAGYFIGRFIGSVVYFTLLARKERKESNNYEAV